jgi:PAS domain S-box-containing protein
MNLMDKEKQERIDQIKARKITFWQHLMSMISWVINPKKKYQNQIQAEKSRLLSIFILLLLIAYGGVDIFGPLSPRIPFLYYLGYGLIIGAIILNRYVHYLIASRLAALLVPFLIFSNVYSGSAIPVTLFYFLVIGLILGSFLIRKRGIIILGAISGIGIILAPITLSSNNLPLESIISPLVINLIATTFIVIKMTHNDLARKTNQFAGDQETQFSSIFNNSPVGILIAREGSILSEANQAASDLLGYSTEELAGMKIPDITHPDDHARTLEMFWKIVAAEMTSFSMEVRFLKKNGEVIWVNLNSTLLFEDTGIPIYGIAIVEDITEAKEAKDALSQEKEKAQQYLDIAGVMIVALDNFGYVTLINQKGCDVLGYSQEEIIGKNWFDHFLPNDEKIWVKPVFERMMAGESSQEEKFQNQIITKEGKERTIAWHNTILSNDADILGTLSAGEDITDQLLAEEEIHQQAETIQAIVDNTQDWIWEIDTDGKHTYSNFAMEHILGISLEGSLGDDLFYLMHDEDRQMVEESFPNWIAERKGWRNLVIRWKHKDGSLRFLESNAEPAFDINGKITGFRGVDRDITHRINAEKELRHSEQNLKRAQKVAKLGSWIWNSATQKFEMSDELSIILGVDESKERPSFESIVRRVHPDDMPKFQKSIDESRINKETDTIDYRFWHELDQRYIHLQIETELEVIQGSEDFILYGTVQDITDRRRVDDALRSSEIRYRTLFDHSTDAISIHDGPEYINVNDTWLKMFGYGEEDVIGKTPFDFSPYYQPDGLVSETKGKEYLAQVSEGEDLVFEWRHTRSDGSEFDVEVGMTLTSIGGKTVHISFLRDITERKEYEESLQHRVKELKILQDVSAICLENVEEDEIITKVTDLIGESSYPDHFGVMLLDRENILRIHPSYRGIAPEDYSY